jgi:hypothetical protein
MAFIVEISMHDSTTGERVGEPKWFGPMRKPEAATEFVAAVAKIVAKESIDIPFVLTKPEYAIMSVEAAEPREASKFILE